MANEDQSISNVKHRSKRQIFQSQIARLLSMLSLTFAYFLIELIVGNITNSVALVADSFHMLSDVISLIIAIIAVRISERRSDINTYGWVRAEVVGANINTVFLLALCLTIIFDAIKRFFNPELIENVNLLLIVGSVGFGINIIGLFLFQGFHGHSHGHSHKAGRSHDHSHGNDSHEHSHNHTNSGENIEMNVKDNNVEISSGFERHSIRALQEVIAECSQKTDERSETVIEIDNETKKKSNKKPSMNMHGVFLHVLADALGSIVVIISALLIKFVPHDPNNIKHWTVYIDPTLSILIVIIIVISTIPLFKETSYILLQTIPNHLQIRRIKSQLLETIPEITGIHELHVWRLTNEKIIASAHLNRSNLTNYMSVADKVKKFFHSLGIHSITIQYECDNDDDDISISINTTQTSNIINSNDEDKIIRDCLLQCKNVECDTQRCCTKISNRTNTLINSNQPNTSSIFNITQ